MILLIDNYDSFTFNLYHQLAVHDEVKVIRNDAYTVAQIEAMQPAAIVISPGPGNPSEAGVCLDVMKQLHKKVPILGICLGHQSIGQAFGANVVRAGRIIHGKTSLLRYEQSGLFKGLTGDVEVMRYHSLVIEPSTLPDDFIVTATAADDAEIMAIQHKSNPLFGLQFHPESIGTKQGAIFIENFMKTVQSFEVEQMISRFIAGEPVASAIVKQAVTATPAIEKALLHSDDTVVIRLLEEVVGKLPFYVSLVLHDTVAQIARRKDAVGKTAMRALNAMQP